MKKILFIFTLIVTLNLSAQEIKFGKVSEEELEEKFHPLDSTADAAYLFKKRRTYFTYDTDNGFTVQTEYHDRIKIYSKEGLEHATKKITYYNPKSGDKEEINSLKAYTFNLENQKITKHKLSKDDIFDEQLNKYRSQKKITFPNVKEGSVLDIKYTVKSDYLAIKPLIFQFDIPVKKLDYSVEIPEYLFFNKRSKGYYSITPKKSIANRTITLNTKITTGTVLIKTNFHTSKIDYAANIDSYKAENVPALKEGEPYVYSLSNYRGGIEYELSGSKYPNSRYQNYSKSWEGVCKTIYKSPSFGNELDKTNYFKEDLANILSLAKNDFDKIALIFQFVKSKVKWNEYYGAFTDDGVKKAYKNGVGNAAEINLILTSMLRSANLKANPVLLSTKNNGIPLFPTINGYNYVISKVTLLDGKYILLDATEKYSNYNTLPFRDLNWYGREIFEGGHSQEVKLIPSSLSNENNILHVKIDESGEVNGMLRKSLTGHSAMFYRQKNNLKKEDEFKNSIEDKYHIEIEDFKVLNRESLSKPIVQNLKFSGDNFVEEINGKLYFSPLFFLATNENPFKSEERNYPIDFGMPWQDQFSVAITIPEGYTIESFPKELAIGLPENTGVFKYKILVQDNKIKLSSVTQFNSSIIAPQLYTDIKEFYKLLVEKHTEKIVLAKK